MYLLVLQLVKKRRKQSQYRMFFQITKTHLVKQEQIDQLRVEKGTAVQQRDTIALRVPHSSIPLTDTYTILWRSPRVSECVLTPADYQGFHLPDTPSLLTFT